jgi:hypothetical protein
MALLDLCYPAKPTVAPALSDENGVAAQCRTNIRVPSVMLISFVSASSSL